MTRPLRSLGSFARRPPVVGGLVLLAVWAVVMNLRVHGRLQYAELKVYDQLLTAQPRDTRAADQIVMVGVDEVDLRAMRRAIMTDRTLTKLLARLDELGAAAVGLDVFRDQMEGSNDAAAGANAADRQALLDTVARTHTYCVELPAHDPTLRVPAPPLYQRARRVDGHVYHPYQQVTTCEMMWDGGTIDQEARRGLLFEPMSDQLWALLSPAEQAAYGTGRPSEFSLSAAVANRFLRSHGTAHRASPGWSWDTPGFAEAQADPWKAVVPRFTPDRAAYFRWAGSSDAGYQYLLDFRGPDVRPEFATGLVPSAVPGDTVRVSLRQLLGPADLPGWADLTPEEKRETPVTPAHNPIAGRMVFVGIEAVSAKDYIPCPRDFYFRGPEYHVLQADQLLRFWKGWAVPRRYLSHAGEAAYILLWGVPGLLLGYGAWSAGRMAVYGTAGVAVLVAVTVVAFRLNWWLPSLPPGIVFLACTLLMAAYASQHERGERRVVDNLFRRTAGDQVVGELWARREDIFDHGRLTPRTVTATLLFIDFQGFSSRTEALATPDLLIEWLERTLRAMTTVTLASGGTILRYMGDSFMVVFGAPVYRTTDAEVAADAAAAVGCGLALREELARLNAVGIAAGEPPLRMRVGINTGPVAVGTIGGGTRMEYTALGDTVNVASRLESCVKDRMGPDVAAGDCRILVSGTTCTAAQAHAADGFEIRCMGEVEIRNHTPVVAYAVMGRRAEVGVGPQVLVGPPAGRTSGGNETAGGHG